MSSRRRKVINYLSNAILLKEIHKTKGTYCEYDDKSYHDYDIIVESLEDMTPENMLVARKNRSARMNEILGDKLFADGFTNKQISKFIEERGTTEEDFTDDEVIVRVLTNEHIPDTKGKSGKIVKCAVNFPPFKHYKLENGSWKNVGKSHYHKGKFSTTHGHISRQLAKSYMLLVERYSKKSNWRNYTWLEEMAGKAIVRLTEAGLQFNEFKSDNPFAYLTAILNNSFTYVLLKEKENLSIRSKLIQEQGYAQSFNEQAEADYENFLREQNIRLIKDDNYNSEQ